MAGHLENLKFVQHTLLAYACQYPQMLPITASLSPVTFLMQHPTVPTYMQATCCLRLEAKPVKLCRL